MPKPSQISTLTPKGPSKFFLQKTPQMCNFQPKKHKWIFFHLFSLSTIGLCPRLLEEHVQKSFAKVDCTDCEIIKFEVKRKVFFSMCLAGTSDFDCLWCKIFQLCNFHEIKIPIVDMKVEVFECPGVLQFWEKKISKKKKSPSSMRNGRLNTSKCRGKLQKMEVLYIHSSKMPSPST